MADENPYPSPTPSSSGGSEEGGGNSYVEEGGKQCQDSNYFISVCETGFVDPVMRHTIVEASATLNDCQVCITAAEVQDAINKINELYEMAQKQPSYTEVEGITTDRVNAETYGIDIPSDPARIQSAVVYEKNGVVQRYVETTPTKINEYTYDPNTKDFIFGETSTVDTWHVFRTFSTM